MKKSVLYTLLTLLVVLGLWAGMANHHEPFDWAPDFGPSSQEPLGCARFDQLMAHSLPLGYETRVDLPDSLRPDSDAVLYLKLSIYLDDGYETEQELARARRLMSHARNGGHVIVATTSLCGYQEYGRSLMLAYKLNVPADRIDWAYYYYRGIEGQAKEMQEKAVDRDTLRWVGDTTTFVVNPLLTYNVRDIDNYKNRNYRTLISYINKHDSQHLAIRQTFKSGGTMTIVFMPLLFTNYGILDAEASQLTRRLLSPIQDRHLIRIEGKNKHKREDSSAKRDYFQFFRKRPPFNWAFKLTLWVMALAMIEMARRRMRAIPLPRMVKNETLEFARFMGTFRYNRHDNRSMVLEAYQQMLHHLGEKMADDADRMDAAQLQATLVSRTSLTEEKIKYLITAILQLQKAQDTRLAEREMMELIDLIREIQSQLS